jgi:hypothetical protein
MPHSTTMNGKINSVFSARVPRSLTTASTQACERQGRCAADPAAHRGVLTFKPQGRNRSRFCPCLYLVRVVCRTRMRSPTTPWADVVAACRARPSPRPCPPSPSCRRAHVRIIASASVSGMCRIGSESVDGIIMSQPAGGPEFTRPRTYLSTMIHAALYPTLVRAK